MLISGMTDPERQAFQEATTLYCSGKHEEAIQKLNELARTTLSPADRAGVLYHEVLWLLEVGGFRRPENNLTKCKSKCCALKELLSIHEAPI